MAFRLEITFNKLPGLGPAVQKACSDVVRKAATDVLADALVRVPVDTGNLKGSGGPVKMIGPLTAEVVFHAEYALYVEYGSSHQGKSGTYEITAQPYLTPAVELIREPFFRAIGAAVERTLKG